MEEVITTKVNDLDTFRQETAQWLKANCPDSMRQPMKDADAYWGGRNGTFQNEDQQKWFEAMKSKNWIVPHWPKAYGGGGLSKEENKILKEEMTKLNCRIPIYSFGIWMLGPALLKFGNEEQKQNHLSKITSGEIRWCQGYSEPNAGSDLASLATSAEDKGDHFIVNGQKVWTSYANNADWIFCLVRTDTESKHRGISFLLIDMKTEGVSTRPIKLISGKSPFCETFFDNVKVPKENIIGEINSGWSIAKYLLTHEREMIGDMGIASAKESLHETAIKSIGLKYGILKNTALRTAIAKWSINQAAFDITLKRASDEFKAGQSLGAVSSFFKYYGTELNKDRNELLMEITGYEGLEWDDEKGAKLSHAYLRSKGNSIEGGTSEIQLNIISKHILQLPSK